jgi:hypothetical protein
MNNTSIKTKDIEMKELNSEHLNTVAGGTFTPNTYSKAMYHAIGISTKYQFFSGDEFRFMGQGITYDQANEMVKLARKVKDMINSGARDNNVIGYSEPAFIRSYNCQLKLYYGLVWDGQPGYDY